MKIKLTDKRLERLSETLANLGLLSIASVILPSALDNLDMQRVALG